MPLSHTSYLLVVIQEEEDLGKDVEEVSDAGDAAQDMEGGKEEGATMDADEACGQASSQPLHPATCKETSLGVEGPNSVKSQQMTLRRLKVADPRIDTDTHTYKRVWCNIKKEISASLILPLPHLELQANNDQKRGGSRL